MKFLKLIALLTALVLMLSFAVACDSGDEGGGDAETTAGQGGGDEEGDGTTAASFITSIKVVALDEAGKEVTVIDEEEVLYNGLKAHSELTIFEIVSDYCSDNDIACVLDEDTGRLVSIDEYSVEEGGFIWTYEVDGKALSDYDAAIANGAEIVITMVEH